MGLSTALNLLGGGISAYGQYEQSRQLAKSKELEAQSLDFNADIYRQQAKIVEARGRLDAVRQRKENREFTSEQQALYSKAGVTLSGSALQTMEQSASNAELDVLLTEFETATEARRVESQALTSKREAIYKRLEAKQAKTAGKYKAASTLLKSVTR